MVIYDHIFGVIDEAGTVISEEEEMGCRYFGWALHPRFKSVNPVNFKDFGWLRMDGTNGMLWVQNYELLYILKNCFNNNRFLEFYPKRVKDCEPNCPVSRYQSRSYYDRIFVKNFYLSEIYINNSENNFFYLLFNFGKELAKA